MQTLKKHLRLFKYILPSGGRAGWQRAGHALALEAMPAEGLGGLNRLHIHGIAS